jgi:RNA recognition motif-containing protein
LGKKLYVGHLPWKATEADVETLFGNYGALASVTVLMERDDPTRSRGFGFVEFENEEDAASARTALNGSEMDGIVINVDEAQEKQRRPSRY